MQNYVAFFPSMHGQASAAQAVGTIENLSPETIAEGFAAAVAGIGGIFAFGQKGDSKEEKSTPKVKAKAEPEPIDVSIPYNSAALLAFQEWTGGKRFDKALFDQFEPLYIQKTVAQVSGKKMAREYEEAMGRVNAAINDVDSKLAGLKSGDSASAATTASTEADNKTHFAFTEK